jgi:NADPH-dependent 2,4-dienoyl-CoA reductase/sulfur reductase-like enzyme
MTINRIAVVGASLAGLRTVQSLRLEGYTGEILVVGDEDEMPYDRPPLSKEVLAGTRTWDSVALQPPGGIDALDAQWMLGRRATALDIGQRELQLDAGTRLAYDAVILATGARPRVLPFPGATLPGIHLLRSLADCRGLVQELAGAQRVAVVGAGFIGCEVAAACRQRGLQVSLVERAALPLVDALGPEAGNTVRGLLVERGVELLCEASVQGFEGTSRVEGIRLGSGEFVAADVVVVAVGVTPNTDWLNDSGLSLADGIVCDATGRCADGVYAAGDVARWDHALFGQIRVEHWSTAVEHGLYLGWRVLAEPGGTVAEFAGVPFFWSDLFDAKIQFVGVAHPSATRHVVPGLSEGQMVVLYEYDDIVVGAFGLRCPALVLRLRREMGRSSLAHVRVQIQSLIAPRSQSTTAKESA